MYLGPNAPITRNIKPSQQNILGKLLDAQVEKGI